MKIKKQTDAKTKIVLLTLEVIKIREKKNKNKQEINNSIVNTTDYIKDLKL